MILLPEVNQDAAFSFASCPLPLIRQVFYNAEDWEKLSMKRHSCFHAFGRQEKPRGCVRIFPGGGGLPWV